MRGNGLPWAARVAVHWYLPCAWLLVTPFFDSWQLVVVCEVRTNGLDLKFRKTLVHPSGALSQSLRGDVDYHVRLVEQTVGFLRRLRGVHGRVPMLREATVFQGDGLEVDGSSDGAVSCAGRS